VAAPTPFAAGDLFDANSGTSITPVIPAGFAADDVAVMECMCNVSSTFSTPTDWAVLGTPVDSSNQSTGWFWKRLTGAEGNPTSTTSTTGSNAAGLYGRIYVWRGCVTTGDPFEAVTNNGTPTSSATPVSGQVITTGPDELVVSMVLVDDDNPWASGMPPTGWDNMGGRLISTRGGDCMSDAVSRTVPIATTVAGVTLGTMAANDFWRTLTFALLPAAGAPVLGTATGDFEFAPTITGLRLPQPQAPLSRAPIPAILMVNTPGDWNVHPYYKLAVTPANWGNATDMALIDAALAANYPDRTRVVLIAEDNGTADGRCVAALNWALRHYDEVQEIALRAPIIDLEERHDRVGGAEATSIETAYGGAGASAQFPGGAGNYVSTPDAASLDIVGDLDLRIELQPTDFTSAQSLVSKYLTTGNQRSYRLTLNATGNLVFSWSVTGSSTISIHTSTVPIDNNGIDFEADGGAIKVEMDVVDGANKTTRFYTSPTIGGSWTQLGATVTSAGNTSIFAGTAVLEIGAVNAGALEQYTGSVTKMELRNGIGGTLVANPDFTVQDAGITSFADSTGKTWTVNGTVEIVDGYVSQMGEWNPGANHRLHIMRQLFDSRLHIWRDSADSVTPAAVTDAIATTIRATLHTSLGTTAEVCPDGQEWMQQKAWQQMKKLHDYARTNRAVFGTWKSSDGCQTVVLPDGRWVTLNSDTGTGILDPDDTWNSTIGMVRNSILIHNGFGDITGQFYSGAVGTAALISDQVENPGSFYWLIGGCMELGLLNIVCDQRTGPGLGDALDRHIVRLDPADFSTDSIISLGDTELRTSTIYPDTDTGFIYGVTINPSQIWRVPIGFLHDLASYTYWDGATWNTDKAQISPVLRNLPGGGTTWLAGTTVGSGNNGGEWDIRRWRTGWLALGMNYLEQHIAIYYSDQPQGPYDLYTHIPVKNVGGLYYGFDLYGYFPFWHPERDDGPNRLMIGYSVITFGWDVDVTDTDTIAPVNHFVMVEMNRDPFA
jgi:hypothetical protein